MEFIADFHIHSKYSRATSKDMDVRHIAEWARLKGITLMGTGDFTHHLWLEELKANFEDLGNGLFKYKDIYFILSAEISSIYSKNGRGYRIHNIVLAPSFKAVDKINETLSRYGNLASDGRPILGLDAEEIARIVFDADENNMVIPAHCLLPDTLVHVQNGLKNIKSVTKRDLVYTHAGAFKKVTKVFQRPYAGEIIRILPYYFSEGIACTPEHPLYALKTHKHCATRMSNCTVQCGQAKAGRCNRQFFKNYRPQWVQANEIEKGDILIFPRFNSKLQDKKEIWIHRTIAKKFCFSGDEIACKGTRTTFVHDRIKVDKDFCRLIGYYLAEGYTNSRDCVGFCFLEKEEGYLDDVINLMSKCFGIGLSKKRKDKRSRGVELVFYSKILCELFGSLFYQSLKSKKAADKMLPEWALWLPIDKQAEIIRGWWRGDAGYTASRLMMNQFKILFLRLGIIPSISTDSVLGHDRRGKHFIAGRKIFSRSTTYYFSNLSFFEDSQGLLKEKEFKGFKTRSLTRHGWLDKNYAYMPVRDTQQEYYRGRVYNLEVSKDNSYTCEFACVHNCWTPWFSLFGSMSGFDRIEDCFEDQTAKIFALETGLSSDPGMNWRLSALDRFTLISNSDSHSPAKIGREANVFNCELDYKTIREVLKTKDKKRFLYTIEFFPEEGKYHFDGHRLCGIRYSPRETREHKGRCPKCGKPLTVGVMNRVEVLADRAEGFVPDNSIPFKNMIPLEEIIADSKGLKKGSVAVEKEYMGLLAKFGTEFNITLKLNNEELLKGLPRPVADGIIKMRQGKVNIQPGYDGEYGIISIKSGESGNQSSEQQLSLF